MKIIEVARQQKDLLNEGIAYIAVWRKTTPNGKRSWQTEDFFPDGGVENDEPIFSGEQKAMLTEIAAIDENAVLLNGYLHSWIGSADEPLNAASIAVGLQKHYEIHNALVSGYLADGDKTAEDSETTETDESAGAVTDSLPNGCGTDETDEAEAYAEREMKRMAVEAQNVPDHSNEGQNAQYEGENDIPDDWENGMTEGEELGLGCERHEDAQGENGMSADDVPETITIELPAANVKPEILTALLNSKATLIEAALGADCAWEREYGTDGLPLSDLPIEFADGKVRFEWLRFGADGDAVQAWSAFLAAAVKFSKTAKRVTAKDGEVENQKFAFRVFLTKLKLDGAEHKWLRRYLLRNLTGDTAFATPESKRRWLEKHGKKAENAEGADNE